ncbi:hypothetical protein MANES_13G143001v8 [Manihot esculenta]|uniref:Uncharacterized protein n=1 Tax=Manihot esculenta TaxID=3983 RepID=A0ACB7GMB7_MANES|nr:hypothetical protein MANES_13G143001v8 [Manihot esculenta]
MVAKCLLPIRLLLVLSLVLSSIAVPATRSLKSAHEENPPSVHFLTQDAMGGEELIDLGEVYYINGRMELEHTDYQGAGANTHHDPKAPGRA